MNKIVRNQNNNGQAQAIPEDDRRFSGPQPLRISENYTMGPQAHAYLLKKFEHLTKQQGKFIMSGTKYHPHGYAAFCRKLFDNAIVQGCCTNDTIIDVGGHGVRTSVSERRINGKVERWTNSIHSMLPIIDADDELRHKHWANIFKAHTLPLTYPVHNSCDVRANAHGLCKCINAQGIAHVDVAKFKSVDSAYYEGVMVGIETEQLRTRKTAYYAFHDYAKAYRRGKLEFSTFDDEAQVSIQESEIENGGGIRQVRVQSSVKENPFSYDHQMVMTGEKDTWCRERLYNGTIHYIVYTVVNRLCQGDHDYILVEAEALAMKPRGLEVINHYFQAPLVTPQVDRTKWIIEDLIKAGSKVGEIFVKAPGAVISGLSAIATKAMSLKSTTVKSLGYKLVDGKWYIKVVEHKNADGQNRSVKYKVRPAYFALACRDMFGKYDVSSATRVVKMLAHKMNEEEPENINFQECIDAVALAVYVLSEQMMNIYTVLAEDKKVLKAKKASTGIIEHKYTISERWANAYNKRKEAFGEFFKGNASEIGNLFLQTIRVFLPMYILIMIARWAGNAAQEEMDPIDIKPDYAVFIVGGLTFLIRLMMLANKKQITHKVNVGPKELKGICVTDKNRLDLALNKGRVDADWKFKDKDWDITGMNGDKAAVKLGCDKGDKIEGVQIGPFIRGTEDIRPTVKHNCKQNIMAASIRACSNKIAPEESVLQEWKQHFDGITGQFLKALKSEGGIYIDLEEWLSKYPVDYRNKIYAELVHGVDVFVNPKVKYVYESFPKKELQISEVPWDWVNHSSNKCKERQISGPSTEKKIAANAVIHALEGVAHRHIKEYCGRKDWPAICRSIEEGEKGLENPIYGFADGSGFDMTQVQKIQRAFTVMMQVLLSTGLIYLPLEITPEIVLNAIRGSEKLKVKVAQGAVSYKAEGRASGDGWTTFGNTLLMISYWTFIFKKAGVPKTKYFLMVKGDDVLFATEKRYRACVELTIASYMARENKEMEFGLGQIVKFVKWGTIEDGDFLSNMFFRTASGIRMTRIPHRVFQTLPWSLKTSLKDKKFDQISKELLFSKGHSLLAWSRGLPIFEKLAHKLISLGKEGKHSEYNKYADADRVWEVVGETDYMHCLSWLNYRFGITALEVQQVENAIDAVSDQFDEVIISAIDKFYVGL